MSKLNPSTKKAKKLKPFEASTIRQICSLKCDNVDSKDFWILLDGAHVVLAERAKGSPMKNSMRIPHRQFYRLARWYVTGKVGK